jgi:hypothetical protein
MQHYKRTVDQVSCENHYLWTVSFVASLSGAKQFMDHYRIYPSACEEGTSVARRRCVAEV